MENKREIKYLLERYIQQEATEEEYNRLLKYLKDKDNSDDFVALFNQLIESEVAEEEYDRAYWDQVASHILYETRKEKNGVKKTSFLINRRKKSLLVGIAAAVILLIGVGWWLNAQKTASRSVDFVSKYSAIQTIRPGGNKAMLTLTNGKKVILDSSNMGLVSIQGGQTKVVNLNQGLLSYNGDKRNDNENKEVQYNTITTPRGGQYKIILADGSKVWLNAASSMRFPVVFSGERRTVYIKGEAYFEIAKNEKQPFEVFVNDKIKVEVLGTHFNVRAYKKTSVIKTTLLEGKVKVINSGFAGNGNEPEVVLSPGQAASVVNGANEISVGEANVNEAVAWKNGLFQFSNTDIATIMGNIARWYDVRVSYPDGVPHGSITGKIPRDTKLSNVLRIMKLSGVRFELEGRKIIVLKK